MEDDEDIKIVYESCDNEEWRAARELLKNQYKIAIETGMPIKSEMPEDGNGLTMRHDGSLSSSIPPLKKPTTFTKELPPKLRRRRFLEYGTTTDVNQDMDPLFVKMELIDVLDGDGDSSSVELLQEDSDSTVSDGTVLREPCDRAAFRTRFSERDDLSEPVHEKDLAERNVRNGVSAFSETSRSRSTKQAQSSKSVASSFLRGVDGLRIDDPDSSQPRSPLPISHDEVTSSSDVTKPLEGDMMLFGEIVTVDKAGPARSPFLPFPSQGVFALDCASLIAHLPFGYGLHLGIERKIGSDSRPIGVMTEVGRKERTPQTASTSRRSETTRKRSFAASTSSALRARGLPRYKPAPRKYDFTRWLDSNGDLVLHKISDVATGQVSGPLGCTYDSALDTFVFTRHDSDYVSFCISRNLVSTGKVDVTSKRINQGIRTESFMEHGDVLFLVLSAVCSNQSNMYCFYYKPSTVTNSSPKEVRKVPG
ncbi:unnamed protein product [Heligmosomoides polygyrus]|uniref:Tub domain-containing protein n=1 Tax=Heligmosomoides polygyrus TaxID=6339 RepID=A0A183FPQ5_HELPZ|nr:unnamed protein product [Heligmosomoides polygyrus]